MNRVNFIGAYRDWWAGAGTVGRWAPLVCSVLYFGTYLALGQARIDHYLVLGLINGVYYSGPRFHGLFFFLLPLVLTGMVYDGQAIVLDGVHRDIVVEEVLELERAWFGVQTDGAVITPARWWQEHTHPILDAVTGLAYLLFIPVYVGLAGWFRFGPGKEKTGWAGMAMMWAMLTLNVCGYLVWILFPVAPPWYVDQYGLGPVVLDAPGDAAGAARFDALFGVQVFESYYSRNANIFGAVPSLHCGQTFQAFLFCHSLGRLRAFSLIFFSTVLFASVYLNHHYILDGLAGMLMAVGIWWIFRKRAFHPKDSKAVKQV